MKLAVRIMSGPSPSCAMTYSGSSIFRLPFNENYLTNVIRKGVREHHCLRRSLPGA